MPESNEHSAEFCRGAVAVLGRMVDECSIVFDSDLPHLTQGDLEDYLAEYAELLAAAEAREAGETGDSRDYLGEARLAAIDLANKLAQQKIVATEVIEAAHDCLDEIDDYRGGAETVLEDEYVTQRRMEALALCARWKEANGGK